MSSRAWNLSPSGVKPPIDVINCYRSDANYASGFDQALMGSYLSQSDFKSSLTTKVVGWHNGRSILLFWERDFKKISRNDLSKKVVIFLRSNSPLSGDSRLLKILSCDGWVL